MTDRVPKGRLYHTVPGWVSDGSVFHLRGRALSPDLTSPPLAEKLLQSVAFYHETQRWSCRLFLLMPDHWHALISFPREPGMSETMRAWKAYQTRTLKIIWQEGYFDHRLRNDAELDAKHAYIRANPVVKGLCVEPDDWPWSWPR